MRGLAIALPVMASEVRNESLASDPTPANRPGFIGDAL
jgi:hypothetical protein